MSNAQVPSAFNIAAVHGCPTIFFCRNNGYAISTNASEQYSSDGVAPRGFAYGMPTIRVDGNDLLAVYAATAAARAIGAEQGRPTLVEAMTYRVGAHSTSDDDSKYREPSAPEEGWDDERSYWEARSPIVRFGRYLHQRGCFSGADEERMRRALRKEAIAALSAAEEADSAARPSTLASVLPPSHPTAQPLPHVTTVRSPPSPPAEEAGRPPHSPRCHCRFRPRSTTPSPRHHCTLPSPHRFVKRVDTGGQAAPQSSSPLLPALALFCAFVARLPCLATLHCPRADHLLPTPPLFLALATSRSSPVFHTALT